MMKQIATITGFVIAAALMSACSKPATPKAPKATAAAEPAQEEARPATYDPNLKPTDIVWDSPQKKAEWEALQAKVQAQAQAAPQAAAPAVPQQLFAQPAGPQPGQASSVAH